MNVEYIFKGAFLAGYAGILANFMSNSYGGLGLVIGIIIASGIVYWGTKELDLQ